MQQLVVQRQGVQKQHKIVQQELDDHQNQMKALELKIEKLNRARNFAQKEISNYKNDAEPEVANIHELVCV